MSTNTTSKTQDILDRPLCKMRPISPMEVVNQLISAKKQMIGASQRESEDRQNRLIAKALQDLTSTKAIIAKANKIRDARKALKNLEREFEILGLCVSSRGGEIEFTYQERRKRIATLAPADRTARLDTLAKLKADALADLIGLDVKETREYLKKFQAKLEAI